MTEYQRAVATVVAAIPAGTVMTYGEVAAEAGFPGAARGVGGVLKAVEGLPWWRVVAADGRLVPGHERRHAELLRRDGVAVADGRVVGSRP